MSSLFEPFRRTLMMNPSIWEDVDLCYSLLHSLPDGIDPKCTYGCAIIQGESADQFLDEYAHPRRYDLVLGHGILDTAGPSMQFKLPMRPSWSFSDLQKLGVTLPGVLLWDKSPSGGRPIMLTADSGFPISSRHIAFADPKDSLNIAFPGDAAIVLS